VPASNGTVSNGMKKTLKKILPKPLFFLLKKGRALTEDLPVFIIFLFKPTKIKTTFFDRFYLIFKCYQISFFIECAHMENEMIQVMSEIFSLDQTREYVIAEAGSFKGGSGAKLSLAVRMANKKLFLFDSFEGLPENNEDHGKNIFGGDAFFPGKSYMGSLDEVKQNIGRFGHLPSCEFIKGWFDDTMPNFDKKVGVAYIDVDLESSTKSCLRYLYPKLISGGSLFSQDGHLPLIIKLLSDENFWQKELGIAKPKMICLGKRKLVKVLKN